MSDAIKLYKSIRRLHRSLPPCKGRFIYNLLIALRIVGNNYVRDEFKRHKDAEKGYLVNFFMEWHTYRNDLRTQIQKQTVGKKLDKKHIEGLSDAQLGQLFSLYEATANKAKSE